MSAHESLPVELLEWATKTQGLYLETYNKLGSADKVAAALGVNQSTVSRSLQALKKKGALQGFSPQHDQTHTVPDLQYVRGVTTKYDKKGDVETQWVKSWTKSGDIQEFLEHFCDELKEDVRGLAPKVKTPKITDQDLLTVYPMGDPHIGMYAWAEECGEDFDLAIADRDLRSAVRQLVDSSPPSDTGLIVNLGDFFHADNIQNRTSRSGVALDVDTRWPKVLRLGAKLMIDLVAVALAKHKKVIVRNVIGNHDDHSSVALSLILDAYYDEEPRVTVELSPAAFWYFEFGNVLIGTAHGHTTKMENLATIMAEDQPVAWGRTMFRHWLTGHIHNKKAIEVGSVLIESFRTLAGKDEWTASSGYRSGRDMNSIVFHQEFGEIGRHRVGIHRVRKSLK